MVRGHRWKCLSSMPLWIVARGACMLCSVLLPIFVPWPLQSGAVTCETTAMSYSEGEVAVKALIQRVRINICSLGSQIAPGCHNNRRAGRCNGSPLTVGSSRGRPDVRNIQGPFVGMCPQNPCTSFAEVWCEQYTVPKPASCLLLQGGFN